jgi:hypothetical protein
MISERTIGTTREICALTGFSEQYLGRLERDGVVRRSSRGRWPLVATINAIIAHLRDRNRRGGSGSDALRKARAKEIEVRTLERERRLIPVTDAIASVEAMAGCVLTELSGQPARVTRDLALRRQIEDEVFGMRERLADRMRKVAEQLQAGRSLDEALNATKRDVAA